MKNNSKSVNTWKIITILLAFIGLFLIAIQPVTVDAASSVLDNEKVKNINTDKDFKITAEYTFIPEFVPGVSKLTVTHPSNLTPFTSKMYNNDTEGQGGGKFETLSIDAGADDWKTVQNNLKSGKYVARYSQVGYIDGQEVDVLVTIKDMDAYGKPGTKNRVSYDGDTFGPITNISFRNDEIGIVTQGFNYVDFEFKTVKSGTNTPIKVSGYYTFNDVDAEQFVGFSDATWNNDIPYVLITNSDNQLKSWRSGGYNHIGSVTPYDSPDDVYDHRYAFTVLYEDTATLNLRWGLDYSLREKRMSKQSPLRRQYRVKRSTGDLLMYTALKPMPTSPKRPTKTQSVNGGMQHKSKITYNVTQFVPYEYSTYWYKNFEMQDQMDSVYDIDNVQMFDDRGNNVSSEFTITTKNNLVRAIAKDTKRQSFYNKSYRMQIDATLDGERVNQKFDGDDHYVIENEGISQINGVKYTSNKVRNNIYKQTIHVRHVDEEYNLITDEKIMAVRGEAYSVKPKDNLKNSRGHLYRHIRTEGEPEGIFDSNKTVTFVYEEPREVIIEHRTENNKDDGYKLLDSETYWEYNGTEVTGYSKENKYRDSEGYFYKPLKKSETKVVNGRTLIVLPYASPRTVTIEHYDKDDDRILRTTYIKGVYDGDRYTAKPLINVLKDVDNYLYRPVDPTDRVGRVERNSKIRIPYERPRIIEILHKDDDTSQLIRKDIHDKRIYDGDGYDIYSYADEELKYYHKENDTTYFYYPVNPYRGGNRARQTGTVIEAKVDKKRNTYTLQFFYTKPSLDLGLSYIRIDTEQLEKDLPVQLSFDFEILHDDRWAENDVTLTVYDRDSDVEVFQKNDLKVTDLEDGYELTAKADHMKKGGKAIYEAVLTTNDKKDLVTGFATKAAIDTNAYTASERIVKGESVKNSNMTFRYEGVAMTERYQGEEIKEYNERMSATIQPSINIISGYGYSYAQEITFETEVKEHAIPEITGVAHGHKNVLDGVYDEVDGRYVFDLEVDNTDGDQSRESIFTMPEVYVSRNDGVISLDNGPGRISGGRKAYVPIWINKLDTYNYNVQTNRLGRHHIMFDLDHKITVDAYMFGHIDSDTLNDDALLIEPAKKNVLDKWFKDR